MTIREKYNHLNDLIVGEIMAGDYQVIKCEFRYIKIAVEDITLHLWLGDLPQNLSTFQNDDNSMLLTFTESQKSILHKRFTECCHTAEVIKKELEMYKKLKLKYDGK